MQVNMKMFTLRKPRPQDVDVSTFTEFKLKIEQNILPGGQSIIKLVDLMIKIKGEKSFEEFQMKSKGQYENGLLYSYNLKIQKNKEYQYYYKVDFEEEKEYRSYKFDSNLENGVDEWNKIWIGYLFNLEKQKQQLQLVDTHQKRKNANTDQCVENFQLIENTDIFRISETQIKNDQIDENDESKGRLVQRSNYLIFQFSDDFIYNQHKNSFQQKQNKTNCFEGDLNKQIQFQKEKFNKFQKNQFDDTNHISNEQIDNLLTPISIPEINDQLFENCKQRLKNINNNLEALKQDKSNIKYEYDNLKIEYDELIQEMGDYEKKNQKNNDQNKQIINKLKQVLTEKQKEIENVQEQEKQIKKQYNIRLVEAKLKYHEEIEQKQQENIKLIENQKEKTILILDKDKKITLLVNENERLQNLLEEKNSLEQTYTEHVRSLYIQIKNYKDFNK